MQSSSNPINPNPMDGWKWNHPEGVVFICLILGAGRRQTALFPLYSMQIYLQTPPWPLVFLILLCIYISPPLFSNFSQSNQLFYSDFSSSDSHYLVIRSVTEKTQKKYLHKRPIFPWIFSMTESLMNQIRRPGAVGHVDRVIKKNRFKRKVRIALKRPMPRVSMTLQRLFESCREVFRGLGTVPSPRDVKKLCHILGEHCTVFSIIIICWFCSYFPLIWTGNAVNY